MLEQPDSGKRSVDWYRYQMSVLFIILLKGNVRAGACSQFKVKNEIIREDVAGSCSTDI